MNYVVTTYNEVLKSYMIVNFTKELNFFSFSKKKTFLHNTFDGQNILQILLIGIEFVEGEIFYDM